MPFELLRFEMLLPAFALVLARVAGVVLAIPMVSSVQIPREAKVGLVFTLSLMLFPMSMPYLPQSLTLGQSVAGMVGELMIGEVIGLGAGLMFYGAEMAGKFISHQAGLALGTVFNPFFDEESTVLDQLWFFTAAMIFMALRGHIATVAVLMESIKTAPPMMTHFDGSAGDFAVSVLQSTFQIGLRLSGPTILALLLSSLIMGFLTRTMPQINVLSVGFAVKIGIALFVMAATISFSEDVLGSTMYDGLEQAGRLFAAMGESIKHGG